jgi:hypothetical protein
MSGLVRYTVYALLDPDTREPRYIGCTRQPVRKRVAGHMGEGAAEAVRVWLDGRVPLVRVLATCSVPARQTSPCMPHPLALAIEASWIRRVRRRFPSLLNAQSHDLLREAQPRPSIREIRTVIETAQAAAVQVTFPQQPLALVLAVRASMEKERAAREEIAR